MTTNQTPSTTTTPSIRIATRRLSRNQLAVRGLSPNHADRYDRGAPFSDEESRKVRTQ
jgi:hypothetical protein